MIRGWLGIEMPTTASRWKYVHNGYMTEQPGGRQAYCTDSSYIARKEHKKIIYAWSSLRPFWPHRIPLNISANKIVLIRALDAISFDPQITAWWATVAPEVIKRIVFKSGNFQGFITVIKAGGQIPPKKILGLRLTLPTYLMSVRPCLLANSRIPVVSSPSRKQILWSICPLPQLMFRLAWLELNVTTQSSLACSLYTHLNLVFITNLLFLPLLILPGRPLQGWRGSAEHILKLRETDAIPTSSRKKMLFLSHAASSQ
jgi:hypothetical protein